MFSGASSKHMSPLENWGRDKSLRAYVKATVGGRGARLRIVSAMCLFAALMVGQGVVLGSEILFGTLVGGVALAYPLWRRWGRDAPSD
jgi:hypothetical protein